MKLREKHCRQKLRRRQEILTDSGPKGTSLLAVVRHGVLRDILADSSTEADSYAAHQRKSVTEIGCGEVLGRVRLA